MQQYYWMTYICCIEILFRCLRKKKSGSHKTKKATEPLKPLSLSLLKVGETRPPSLSFSPLASGLQQHTQKHQKAHKQRERYRYRYRYRERQRKRERNFSRSLSYKHANPALCHSFHFYPSNLPQFTCTIQLSHSSSESPFPWRFHTSSLCWSSWGKMGFQRPRQLSKWIWSKRVIWVLLTMRNSCFQWSHLHRRSGFRRLLSDRRIHVETNRDLCPRMMSLLA